MLALFLTGRLGAELRRRLGPAQRMTAEEATR
jgi:hypothetical protein